MLSTFAKLLLTGTAIAPVLLTCSLVLFLDHNNGLAVLFLVACAILTLTCVWMLHYARKHLERISFSITTVEAADRENVSILLLYLLPLVKMPSVAIHWQILVPAILIIAVVTVIGYGYHFNPLLGLMRWHFYKVGTKEGVTYVLITKKQLRNATETNEVCQLTEYVVIDLGENG